MGFGVTGRSAAALCMAASRAALGSGADSDTAKQKQPPFDLDQGREVEKFGSVPLAVIFRRNFEIGDLR